MIVSLAFGIFDVIRRVGGLEVKEMKNMNYGQVIRRVGGLEDSGRRHQRDEGVIRRVGGLEAEDSQHVVDSVVIRRVGGLEVPLLELRIRHLVIRRVGGLENQAGGCPPKAPSSRLGLFTSTLDIDSFIWREWQKGRRTCLNIF